MPNLRQDVIFADGSVKTVVADNEEELAENVLAVQTDRPLAEAPKAVKRRTTKK